LEVEAMDQQFYFLRLLRQRDMHIALQQCIDKFGEELEFFMV
jgi:hypothetical protein